MNAASQRNYKIVKLLLKKGAGIDMKDQAGRTTLIVAASSGCYAVVRLLLKKGADVNAADQNGDTALIVAAGGDNKLEIVGLLLEYGANVDATTKGGRTALMVASSACCYEIAELLLEQGATVNAEAKNGETAFCSTLKSVASGEAKHIMLHLLVCAHHAQGVDSFGAVKLCCLCASGISNGIV